MKKLIVFSGLLTSLFSYGQAFRNYSNEFLNIGVDAAALGMSKSVIATTNNVNSAYWNPAGLVHIKDNEGSLMHASYFAGIANYDFAAFAMPIDEKSALGVSIIRFGVDDILNTTALIDSQGNIDFNRISLFSAADYAFTFSYARKLPIEGLNFGANAKIIRRIIGDFATSWGIGFDAGIQYQKNQWSLGLMVRDITTTFNSWSFDEASFNTIKDAIPDQNQEIPESTEITKPKVQFGVAKVFNLKNNFHLLTEFDLSMRFTETNDLLSSNSVSVSPDIGFQLDFNEIVFLRTGVGNFQYIDSTNDPKSFTLQPNFGVGFHYKGIQIDYALTNIGSLGNALYSNIFSLKIEYSFFRKRVQ